MSSLVIKNALIVNRGKIFEGDVLVKNKVIEKIDGIIEASGSEIDAKGKYLIPGIIDDQVHFREPGYTYKADIASESRAALIGGTTTFMEMPNTKPAALTQELLQDKYDIAKNTAFTNYSFFMGASNDNLEEVLKTDGSKICGIKAFMGSSTGNMLVDDPVTLEKLFKEVPILIATHCEDENTIRNNLAAFEKKYGDKLTAAHHPEIRNVEGCYKSSSFAVELAKRYNTRLHILHISTEKEISLFNNNVPLEDKRITSEACVHHMYYCDEDYARLGNKIKCNPAIKSASDREAIFQAMLDNKIDIIATDHAPHTLEEKNNPYSSAPSGLPLVQHSLNIMLDFYQKGKISLERVVEKMCHAPAECFNIDKRGYIDEGFYADMVLIDPDFKWTVTPENIIYKCGWSPLEGKEFTGRVDFTIVNGEIAYNRENNFIRSGAGERISFLRS